MKKAITVFCILIAVALCVNWQKKQEHPSANKTRSWLLKEIKATQQQLISSIGQVNVTKLQQGYHTARMHYKQIELFIEYYSPREAKYFINGPLVPKHDEEFGIRYAQGFQRIEEILFDSSVKLAANDLHREYNLLIKQLNDLSNYYEHVEIQDGVLLEMCQLELFRIAAMNLNGYDASISKTNVKESLWCLQGIETVLDIIKSGAEVNEALSHIMDTLFLQLSAAKVYLMKHNDYDTFNRLQFITAHINGLNKSLVALHNAVKLPWSDRKQALNLKQPFLFGKESFNRNYFSIYYNDTLNQPRQAALGKLLFFDPVLSGSNRRSCASCHNPAKGFTDGLAKSLSINGEGPLSRNTPTLLNVIYQKAFFYDGRAYQLEQQVFDVVHNKTEMQSTLDEVVEKLRKSKQYLQLFAEAFNGSMDTVITHYAIQKALTEYEKTLVSFNSRFDQYLRGNTNTLNQREVNGYNLFAGKALCGSCHFLPLFNGTVPPMYSDSEFEVIGVATNNGNKALDQDSGRFTVTRINEQLHAFKTPTVRNIALTAPYMHNGAYNTLEEIVEFYHRGGGKGFGFAVPNQTLPFDSLQLNANEKENIVLFMKTLTDTIGTIHKPLNLPVFENNEVLNKRELYRR